MNRINFRPLKAISILLGASLALGFLSGCTGIFSGKLFKERAAETPVPDETGVDKNFFVDPNGKPKTFLCAWAPEVAKGWSDSVMPFVNEAAHCNVEWEITEHYLLAKQVNPSFLNERDRWTEMLRIPITKHYYYERNKDQYGRETNEWIENSSRSHWSARPKMKLNFARIEVTNLAIMDASESHSIHSNEGNFGWENLTAQDIEWDSEKGFVGFSINGQIRPWGGYNVGFEARFRFNFLKFEHDPTFKRVPYHQENSRFVNVLHVMGKYIDGVEPQLYAAHWDVRETHDLYISNAPKEHQATIIASIEKWNQQFVRIGAVKPGFKVFNPIVKDMKYPFDLRYPTITWLSDRRLAQNAPLGIGMAHADVRNGKILWGGIVLWGGMLEQFINSYSPTETSAATTSTAQTSPFASLVALLPTSLPLVSQLAPANASLPQMQQRLAKHIGIVNQEIGSMAKNAKSSDPAVIEALKSQIRQLQTQDPASNKIFADAAIEISKHSEKATEFFRRKSLTDLLGKSVKPQNNTAADLAAKDGNSRLARILREKDLDTRTRLLKAINANASPFFVERELTVENKVGGWMNASARTLRSYPDMMDSIVAALVVHELGHVMGLGHQFKENIVPKKGTVPSKYVKELAEKATAEKEFTNISSIMGYQSPRTELAIAAKDVGPGPQDDLVMRYMYKGEYAAYDKNSDSFAYIQVPASGKIPNESYVHPIGVLPTSYFPQCNDMEASLGGDPFCNRFDRGNEAVDIVNNYFEMISDNLLANMYSLVGASGNSELAEWKLWTKALKAFPRVRMFYDEMRRRLRSEPALVPLWNDLRNDVGALFEFSNACEQTDPTDPKLVQHEVLRKIFANKEMVDLCRANGRALNEFEFFLTLPDSDYTRIDHTNRYVGGGYLSGDAMRNWGHIFGSWYQMSNLPLKFTSLMSVVGTNPLLLTDWGLTENPYYNYEENRYLYRTLYPAKFTHLIANSVQSNMRFAANGRDEMTTMGRTVLLAGSMLPWSKESSNDSAKLPDEFNVMLNQQTQFNFGMVAVLIEAVAPNAKENVETDYYKKFTATIFDFTTGKAPAARDIFLLPNGQIFVWANGMFIYPITKIKFWGPKSAYVLAYKVDYDKSPNDDLEQIGLKATLNEKNMEIANICVKGFDNNGLLSFFDPTNPEYKGFKILPGIDTETGDDKLRVFYQSLKENYTKYEATANKKIPKQFPIQTMTRICEEVNRGVGEISASAALAGGYWLGITSDYVEK